MCTTLHCYIRLFLWSPFRTLTYWTTSRIWASTSILELLYTLWWRMVWTTVAQKVKMLCVEEWAATTTLLSSRSTPPLSSVTSKSRFISTIWSKKHMFWWSQAFNLEHFGFYIRQQDLSESTFHHVVFSISFLPQHNHRLHSVLMARWLLRLGETSIVLLSLLQHYRSFLQRLRYSFIKCQHTLLLLPGSHCFTSCCLIEFQNFAPYSSTTRSEADNFLGHNVTKALRNSVE